MKSLTINGKRWRLTRRPRKDSAGHCCPPDQRAKTMYIPTNGKTQDALRIIIHEIIHAGVFVLDEETVDTLASDVARVLWKLKWRKQ
jgi:hypothetical protein